MSKFWVRFHCAWNGLNLEKLVQDWMQKLTLVHCMGSWTFLMTWTLPGGWKTAAGTAQLICTKSSNDPVGKWCRKKRDAFLPPELTVRWSNHEYGTLEEEKVSSYWGLSRTCPVSTSVGQCLECLNRQKKTAWKWTATYPGLGDRYKQEQK